LVNRGEDCAPAEKAAANGAARICRRVMRESMSDPAAAGQPALRRRSVKKPKCLRAFAYINPSRDCQRAQQDASRRGLCSGFYKSHRGQYPTLLHSRGSDQSPDREGGVMLKYE
jgi:hypothetical protein